MRKESRQTFIVSGANLPSRDLKVIECFSLTNRKNAADIRIVIDILQSLSRPTRYDEFIIASSDSDFTPLLQCLRANGHRTIILSPAKKPSPPIAMLQTP